MIHSYIRNKKHEKIGVLVAEVVGNSIRFGYSLCSKLDTFDKKLGIKIACDRALSGKDVISHLPRSIWEDTHKFVDRAKKYFKDKNVPSLTTGYVELPNKSIRDVRMLITLDQGN